MTSIIGGTEHTPTTTEQQLLLPYMYPNKIWTNRLSINETFVSIIHVKAHSEDDAQGTGNEVWEWETSKREEMILARPGSGFLLMD
jgi:hypothetical protein